MIDRCSDCGRPKRLPFGDNHGDRCEAANGWGPLTQQLKCAQLTLSTLRERHAHQCRLNTTLVEQNATLVCRNTGLEKELSALRELEAVALGRGRTPNLSNQVRLDEMCREMAIAHRKTTNADR